MKAIETMFKSTHSALPGVEVYSWDALKKGKDQKLIVSLQPNAKIPLHSHSVDAEMIIVSGSGEVLFDENQLLESGFELDRNNVALGDRVLFPAEISHGFKASIDGLTFLSFNGGIVDQDETDWDIQICG